MISKNQIIFVLGLFLIVHYSSCITQQRIMSTKSKEAGDSLWPIFMHLKHKKFVDLTLAFDTDIPHWKG